MKDKACEIIYVGKAKHLKKRVSSYFKENASLAPKIKQLVSKVCSIDYVTTQTEKEALILENRYIKQNNPKYNTRLKDSKTFPYLKLSLKEEFPRLVKTRVREEDKALYFGPYVSERYLDSIQNIIAQYFNLRRCRRLKKDACLYFHLEVCSAPCIGRISETSYAQLLKDVVLLLEGKYMKLQEIITQKMYAASADLKFESAQNYKNQLEAITDLHEKQHVEAVNSAKDFDYFLLLKFHEHYIVQIFRIKNGYLVQNYSFDVSEGVEISDEDLLTNSILQFYLDFTDLPHEIIVEQEIYNQDFINIFTEKKVKIKLAVEAEQIQVMEMLKQNAYHTLNRKLIVKEEYVYEDIAKKMKQELGLRKIPQRIIGVDISHLGGENIVASMVTFYRGVPEKNFYRKFNIKTVAFNDDYASIKEVVSRIFKNITTDYRPDLVLIDGGLGQLNAALEALTELGIENQDICSLAKKEEIIYLPDNKERVQLERTNIGLKILQQVRDEAHRFALNFQRTKRKKIFK